MLCFENIDISFRPELDKIGIMFKKGNYFYACLKSYESNQGSPVLLELYWSV